MYNIIISHYNENLDWIQNLNTEHNKIIYSKTINENNIFLIPLNKGHEASAYIKYIIDYYDNLSEKNLFLHGHQNSGHQDYSSDFIINNINWNLDSFFSVNRRDYYTEVSKNINTNSYNWLIDNWYDIFSDKIPFPNEGLFFYSCAQFVVSRDLILQYDLNFYKRLYNWLMDTNLHSDISGRIFEYIWNYIFTKKTVEKKHKNILN